MIKRSIISALIVLICINLVNASVVCDRSEILASTMQGTIPSQVTIGCSNSDNVAYQITKSSQSFFSINNFNLNPNQTNQNIIVTFSNVSSGTYVGAVTVASNIINILLQVNQTPIQQLTGCQINPSLISYTQAIQQGTKIPLPIITFSPTDCPSSSVTLTSSSVSIQGGIITPEGQKPLSVVSVVPNGINILLDTTGLNTQQTYSSTLTINQFGKTFQIPFVIVVTAGTSMPSNVTGSNLPNCALSNTQLTLNKEYTLVCSGILPDVTITPSADTDFIIGSGLESSFNQWSWKFIPIRMGNTNVTAFFYYRNAPIGKPYSQEVKITSGGQLIPGTLLNLLYTPSLSLAKSGEDVIIQLIDNKTGSLVSDPEIFIDAKKLEKNNSNFIYRFDSGRNYQVRGRSSGYDDVVQTITLTSKLQNLTINPSSGDSATYFTINSSAENSTIYIDSKKVDSPYKGYLSEGSHEIRSIKEGYLDSILNFTVEKAINLNLTTLWGKGIPQIFISQKNISWSVEIQKDYSSEKKNVLTGNGNTISFTPNSVGIYTISSDSKVLATYEIAGWDGKILGIAWYYLLLAIVIIGLLIKILFRSGSSDDLTGFSASSGGSG